MDKRVADKFTRGGFSRADKAVKKRIIMALDGQEKGGKTNFALTAPGPIGVINLDIGLDGVVQKFQTDKEIWVCDIKTNIQDLKSLSPDKAAKEADIAYQRLYKGYREVLGEARTIIWDNATEVWELLRMSRFGKLDHVKPHHYGPVNAEYRELIRLAFDQEKTNLILLHKMKDEYVNDSRTGKVKRAGFSDTGFLVQCNALAWRDTGKDAPEFPDCFHVLIHDCRQNAEIAGLDLTGADANFATLAQLVFPDTTEADWQ